MSGIVCGHTVLVSHSDYVWVVYGCLGHVVYCVGYGVRVIYVEIEMYLSQFWTLGLGLRLVLGFVHLHEFNSPKNSPSLRASMDRGLEHFYVRDRRGACT